jgi:hypothetical protein
MDFLYSGLAGRERKRFLEWKRVEVEGDVEYGQTLESISKSKDSLLKALEANYENQRALRNRKIDELHVASQQSLYHKHLYADNIEELLTDNRDEFVKYMLKIQDVKRHPYHLYDDSDTEFVYFADDEAFPPRSALNHIEDLEEAFAAQPLENDF